MLHKLRQRAQDERGFTLIELLVVILIIGILAAIALPTFLGQQKKGQDASAKSNARNAVTQIESCYVDAQSYATCSTASGLGNVGLTLATGTPVPANQVYINPSPGGTDLYSVTAGSSSNNQFTITKHADGTYDRTCTAGGAGSCPSSLDW